MSQDEITPLVSVVTPTYNRARELPETIESVLAQTYANIEYIILDDGSTDGTPELLRRYEPRLKWVRHDNMGEARSVNRGWQMARGEFIVSVSSDDPLLPDLVACAVTFMQANPDVLVGYPDWLMIDEEGRVIKQVQTREYDHASMVLWNCCMPGPGAIIRRRAFELAGYRNPDFRYMSDYDHYLRVSLHGPFARIPHTLAKWRDHRGATTNMAIGPKLAAECVRVAHAFFAAPNVPAHIRAIESESLAVTYYLAGVQCLEVKAFSDARRYFLRSVYYHPHSTAYPTGLQRSVPRMLSHVVLPAAARRWIKRALAGRASRTLPGKSCSQEGLVPGQ